jgi:large subunit ribosomal protein L25
MNTIPISVEARSGRGKGAARRLRSTGLIPAVAYGSGNDSLSLTLDPKALEAIPKSELRWNAPVLLKTSDGEGHLALVQDLERHPLSRAILHVDFRLVEGENKVSRKVPVRLSGPAKGELLGGQVQHLRRFVRMVTQVSTIPAAIVVDITNLDMGEKILMSSCTLPDGCTLDEGDFAVVICEGRSTKEEEQKEELVFI